MIMLCKLNNEANSIECIFIAKFTLNETVDKFLF